MNRKTISLFVLTLSMTTLLLTGCLKPAAPDVTEIPEVTDLAQQDAEMSEAAIGAVGDSVTEEPTEEATAVPTEEATEEAQPTEAVTEEAQPTEAATEEVTEEVTPEVIEVATEEAVAVVTVPGQHVVQRGENLFRIALRYGTTVEALAQANGITNPALIYVGQALTIPGEGAVTPAPTPGAGETVHVVQAGENLFRIALKYNYDYYYLASYNNISNPAHIYVGQQICIPVQ